MIRRNWFMRNFSFEGLYFHICLYGESYTRPLAWTSLIVVAFTAYFWYLNIPNLQSLQNQAVILSALNDAGKRSLSTIFPFFELQNHELVDYALRLILLPILGTMFIALRRKLERKFRH